MTDGLAVELRYLPAPSQPTLIRPYVADGQVWCGDGWWPFTVDALLAVAEGSVPQRPMP